MKDDYLWDGSGEADPDVAQLEQLLRPLRHRRQPLRVSLVPPSADVARLHRRNWRGAALFLALAATLVLLVRLSWQDRPAVSSDWTLQVASVEKAPEAGKAVALRPNEWIVVDQNSRALLNAQEIGMVEVEPGSRLRLIDGRGDQHRLALSVGVMHAQIWASPGRFSVETPSTTAVDLGCAYTLQVDRTGASYLHVTMGWVGLANERHEIFVPAGAVCTIAADGASGTPHREDASPALVEALRVLDARGTVDRAGALDVILDQARADDAFTLWHLLTRLDAASASRVYARLEVLAPPPSDVTRERILRHDTVALDVWWNSFGIGDTKWYRTYRARTGNR